MGVDPNDCFLKIYSTRMHSSRMHTVHCSGRLGGGVVSARLVSAQGCVSAKVGVCPGRGVYLGVSAYGVSTWGCLPRGVFVLGDVHPPDPEAGTLPLDRILDTC